MTEDVTQCTVCGANNRTGAKFCQECGSPMGRACPRCQAVLTSSARFCDACGHRLESASRPAGPQPRSYTPDHLAEKILRDRAAIEGERRTVTVLFADAVGSTPIAERLGEEEMYSLMQGALALMLEAVHHYEGHVANFTGDGMMALFGAPIACEEPERRAVAAALRMQRSLNGYSGELQARHGVEARFRVGLNTGPVVVGKVSDELAMEFTAIGDTVNLAARMEQIAEPGGVYLTEATYRPVAGFVDCEALGPREVKGKAEPTLVWRALSERPLRTRFELAAERGLAPYVGRTDELETLERHLARVRAGRGHVVLVSGEAGIGKSRLLLEFRRRAEGSGVRWLEGHCISYGQDIPYLPVIDFVKQAFGVEEADGETTVISRVEDATAGWDEQARATVPYLRYLLSVDPGDARVSEMDPRERRAEVLDALRALLVAESAVEPVVIAVEDLHWVDEMSAQSLSAVVDLIPQLPILLLLTTRPGDVRAVERASTTRLALDRLDGEESTELVRSVLGTATLPAKLEELVAAKAEGNPFYTEEVLRSLLETGVLVRHNGSYTLSRSVGEVRIPDTIQEVILSRIDRLEREARSSLQLASVIGREFTARLLGRISNLEVRLEEALRQLKELELIYEKAFFPELAYMFKHALTRDVAYSTLVADRRRVVHRVVAAAVEELYADRLTEHYETLAHHYYEGQDWEKALDYLGKAGTKAAAAYANQDALDYYSRALEICERLGQREAAATMARRRGQVSFRMGRFAEATSDYTRMYDAARSLGDRCHEAEALAYRGLSEVWNHEFEAGDATLRRALALAEREGLAGPRAAASLFLGLLYVVIDRLPEADAHLDLVREYSGDLDAFGQGYWSWLASRVELWAGRLHKAKRMSEEGRRAEEGFTFNRAWGRWNTAHALATIGDYEAALAVLAETIATCERVGEEIVRVRCLNTVGFVYGELLDLDQAMAWNRDGLEAARAIHAPTPEVEMNALVNLGENLVALGRLDEAEEQFRLVERVVRDPRPNEIWMHWRYSQRFLHSFGEYWLARGEPTRAFAFATECLAMAEHSGSRKNIAKARRLRGQALCLQGMLDDAQEELAAALTMALEVGSPPQVWKTHVALGQLQTAQGRDDEARQAYSDALAVIDGVAASLTREQLRQTFLASPHVQVIRRSVHMTADQ